MKEIMTIEDSFSTKEAGVIVSGVNPDFDSLDQTAIKKIIGGKVRVVAIDGSEINAPVRDIAISESIVGRKNISIALGELASSDQEFRGSTVYAVDLFQTKI